MDGWNGWHHCIINTYGSWLPGDPRGFHTRHHRQHIEGDYKNPPPAHQYDGLHRSSRASMKNPRVEIAPESRPLLLAALLHALVTKHQIDTLIVSAGGRHCHLLSRFPDSQLLVHDDPVRHYIGVAKERSAKELAKAGAVKPGQVWSKRGAIIPIKNRDHQVRVFNYIRQHFDEGAAVWHFKMPMPQLPEELQSRK